MDFGSIDTLLAACILSQREAISHFSLDDDDERRKSEEFMEFRSAIFRGRCCYKACILRGIYMV